ncbi:MAG TPA: PAS domain S-box protein, partial [Halobacteriales archaeon]|nr:PAS domain S-box protein [Halobacteriales archaeon]
SDATIHVLHVDDDEDFTTLSGRFLRRESEALSVEVEPDPAAARDRLVGDDPEAVDCVVSDLDMPGPDGLDLLAAVREARPDLPFILFTGKGSEKVASEAIAAGVTDYLQKSGGSDQFAILANRIENAVAGHRARQEIERAERRFRKLIEESVDVVAVFDVEGTFRYLSPAAEAVVGYEPEALVGENVFEHLHPDDRDRVLDRFGSLFEDGVERVSARCQFRAEDGSWVDLDVRGRDLRDDPDVGGVLVYGQDASGRVSRDRELERYETMVNESGDMIYATDEAGHLTTVNDAAASFVGYPREELVGDHVSKIVTEESFERGYRAVTALHESDDPSGVTLEQEYVTAGGEVVPGEAHLTVLRGPDRSFHGTVGVVRDITARKEREQTFRALHEATHRLVAAESREEVVDVLVATASDVLGLTLVGLWLYDDGERALRPVVYPDDPALPDQPPTFREGESLSWQVFADGESRVYNDLGSETGRHNPETEIGSELVVPIGDHGVLNSGSTDPGAFDETDRYLADILSRTAAAALDRVERETVLERLHGATRGLMEAVDREEIAQRTVDTAREILGHSQVVFRLLSPDGEELVPVAATDRVHAQAGARPTYPPGEGTAGAAFAHGEVVAYDVRDLDDGVERGGVQTLLCVPAGEHGVLTIAHDDPDAFDDSEVQLARILAA